MLKYLIAVRHGESGDGDFNPLAKEGRVQIEKLGKVITAHLEKAFGQAETTRLLFSFSALLRAMESTAGLRHRGEDFIVTTFSAANRKDISDPTSILAKVLRAAERHSAEVVLIVAHGEMPSVIAETASEHVTGTKLAELKYVRKACGYVTNMETGQVVPISYDDPLPTA